MCSQSCSRQNSCKPCTKLEFAVCYGHAFNICLKNNIYKSTNCCYKYMYISCVLTNQLLPLISENVEQKMHLPILAVIQAVMLNRKT